MSQLAPKLTKRWATTVLGLLLFAEGFGKALDLPGYAADLAAFPLVTEPMASWLAPTWMLGELVAGFGVALAGTSRRPPYPFVMVAAVLGCLAAVGYAVLTTHAFVTGVPIDNCTCFGVYLQQELSGWVLLQDAYMLLFTFSQARLIARWRPQQSPRSTPQPAT